MQRWSIGRNSIYKTASVWLEEAPWWSFLLQDLSQTICGLIPPIPFPKIGKIVIADEDVKFYGKKVYNWNEYWGNLSQWWHNYIDDPVFWFFYKQVKHYSVDIDYKLALKLERQRKSKKI